MSQAFNLTAQINLQAPANLKTVVAQIRRELGTVSADVKINISGQSARNIENITRRLEAMNASLIQARNNTSSLDSALKSLSSSLGSIQSASAKTTSGLANTSTTVKQTAKNIQVATTEMEEFGKQSALAIRRFAAFSVVTTGVFALTNAITGGFKAFVEFDKELVKLQQVTGKGSVGLRGLEKEITNLATSLGVSSKSLVEVASTLAQAGLSAEDTRVALAALAKTELAPSFDNLTDTTEGAIAALRQFGLQAKDLEKALGSINAVAAAFAVESKDIIAAIQRTGGVFAASSRGVSEGTDALNEFVAVFTSVRATTRESAETIATGLRTIFTRIQRAKTIDQLKEFGVQLTDLEGKFVGPFEAVKRLSQALSQLDPRDLRFSAIVEELGGFRQIGKVIPLIQQFATAQEALKVAQKGQGSLTEAQITAQKSLANQLAKVREQFLALIRDIGKSQTFQGLFKVVTGLASGLISLASAFKPILPILAIMGAVKGVSAITQFASGFAGGIKRGGGASSVGSNIGESLSGAKDKEKSDVQQRANTAIAENTSAIKTLTTAMNSLVANIAENTRALAASGSATLNSGGIVRKFARGGLVPGSGNGDTIPAMLEPGEFVIRKKAVETLGASNLHKINRYADGGIAKETKVGVAVLDAKNEINGSDEYTINKGDFSQYAKTTDRLAGIKYLPKGRGYTVIRETLDDKLKPLFNKAIDTGIVSGLEKSLSELGSQYEIPLPLSSNSAQAFLKGINDATRGNVFESMLTALSTNGNFDPDANPQAPFDYVGGFQGKLASSKLFQKIRGLNYIDAKASEEQSRAKNIAPKILLQLFKENQTSGASDIESRITELLQQAKPNQSFSLDEIRSSIKGTNSAIVEKLVSDGIIKKEGRYYQKLASGGIAEAPLIDDILQTSGSILPRPSFAIDTLIRAGGGAVDIDRTLKRTLGDKAYSSAPGSAKNSVLSRYFRDDNERLKDIQSAPLTNFGRELISAIRSKQLDASKLSIISKSKRTRGVAEYLHELFGIPIDNIVFTQGGDKQPALDAIRTKGPRVNRVRKFLGGIIQRFKLGGSVYDLQKGTGLSSGEFDEIVKFSNTNNFSMDEFKTYLAKRIEQKKSKTGLMMNPASLLRAITPEAPRASSSQMDLARSLMGAPDAKYNPKYDNAIKKAAGGRIDVYHGSNTGKDDSVLNSFMSEGAKSDIAQGYGQGAGFYVYTEKEKALRQAKMRTSGGGFVLAQGDKSGRPMVLTFNEQINPDNWDLDYELEKNIVTKWLIDNYDKVKSNIAPRFTRETKLSGISGIQKKDTSAGIYGNILETKDSGGKYTPISDAGDSDIRQGRIIGEIMNRLKSSDPDLVRAFEEQIFARPLGLTLKYTGGSPLKPTNIEKFATGGSVEDTVPALLTPGEFVINKKAAQKIGYGKLNKMNKADKIQGFNKGGAVGSIQRFAEGGEVAGVSEKSLQSILRVLVAQEKNSRTSSGQKLIDQIEETIANQSNGLIQAKDAIVQIATGLRSFAIENKRAGNDDRADSLKNIFDALDKLQQSRGGNASLLSVTNQTLGINNTKPQVDQFSSFRSAQSGPVPDTMGPRSPLPDDLMGLSTAAKVAAEEQAKAAEQAEYLAGKIKESGQSLSGFSKTIATKVVGRANSLVADLPGKKQDLRMSAIGLRGKINNQDEFKNALSTFAAKLKDIDPDIVQDSINKAAESIAKGIQAGDSFDRIIATSTELSDILKKQYSATEATEKAFESLADETGIAADELKKLANPDLIRRQQFIQSPEGQRFGKLAQIAPDAVQKFAGTRAGGALGKAADFASGKGIVASVSKKFGDDIGKSLDKWLTRFGGPMGVLGVGLSVLGDQLPNVIENLGMGSSTTAAGIAGGIKGAGQGLASGAVLGAQVAGPIGALIGGVTGAIVSGISGAFEAYNDKKLENNLRALDKASSDLEIAFKKLDASATQVNFQETEAKFGATITSIADVAQQANLGANGIGRGITEILRGLDPTGLISSLTGAKQEGESRKSTVDAISKAIGDADRLGSVRLNKTSTESIAGFLDSTKNLDKPERELAMARANQGYQALKDTGMGEESIFLSRGVAAQQQSGKTADEISRDMGDPKKRAELIQKGKELFAVEGEIALKQAILTRTSKDLAVATEQLLDVYRRAQAGLEKYGQELAQFETDSLSRINDLTGNASIKAPKRANERVLENISAYSIDEVKRVADETSRLAGGGDSGQKLKNDIITSKILKDELPKALRGASSNNVDDVLDKLDTAFQNAGVDFSDAVRTQLSDSLKTKTEGRQNVGLSDLADDASILDNLLKGTEAGLKFAQDIQAKYNDTIAVASSLMNKYNDVLGQAEEYQRKAVNTRLNAELDLAKALGRSPTLRELNRPVDTEIKSLTGGLVVGGTTDPNVIAAQMSVAQKAVDDSESRLANPSLATYGVKNQSQLDEAIKKDIQALGKQKKALNDGTKALEKLANDGTKAANALSKIQSRQQTSQNAVNIAQRLLTSDETELADISRQLQAYTKTISGQASGGELGSLQFRKDAFAGLDNIKSVLPESIAKQMQAKLTRQMLSANPAGAQILQQNVGIDEEGKPITLDQALSNVEGGKLDPVQQKQIEAYNQAVQAQVDAANLLGDKALEAANILQMDISKLMGDLTAGVEGMITQLQNILPQAQADAQGDPKPEVEAEKSTDALAAGAAGPGTVTIPGFDEASKSNTEALIAVVTALGELGAAIFILQKTLMMLTGKGIMDWAGKLLGGGGGAGSGTGGAAGGAGRFGMSGVGLGQITAPLSGGAGVFGANVGGGAAGAALGASTAVGAAYGGYVVLDTLNSLGEFVTDAKGKMEELNSRSAEQLNQGYVENVLQNLQQPGDSIIDFFSGAVEVIGGIGSSAAQQVGIIENELKNLEILAKKSRTESNNTNFASNTASALNQLSPEEQNRARDEASLRLRLKKTKEIEASNGSLQDLESAGIQTAGFESVADVRKNLEARAASSAAERASTRQKEKEARGDWYGTTSNNKDTDIQGFDVAVNALETDTSFASSLDNLAQAQQATAADTAKTAKMADEATKPGSIYTHDIHLEEILNKMLSIFSSGSNTDNKPAMQALKDSTDPTNKPDIRAQLEKQIQEIEDYKKTLGTTTSDGKFQPKFGVDDYTKEYTKADANIARIKSTISRLPSSQTSAVPVGQKDTTAGIGQTLTNNIQQNSIVSDTQSNVQKVEAALPQLSRKQIGRLTSLRAIGKLRASEDGLPIGRTPEQEQEYQELKKIQLDSNPALKNKIRLGELGRKGKSREGKDGLPTGRSPEEEKEYQGLLASKPKTPYEQMQSSKREAYLSRLNPATRAIMERKLGISSPAIAEPPLSTGPIPTSVSTQQVVNDRISGTPSNDRASPTATGTGSLISLDDNSRQFLETFSASLNSFGSYIDKLSAIKIPDSITMKGEHVVDVRISGAAAFEGLKKDFANMIQVEISNKMAMIWKQTGGKVGEAPTNTIDSNAGSIGQGMA